MKVPPQFKTAGLLLFGVFQIFYSVSALPAASAGEADPVVECELTGTKVTIKDSSFVNVENGAPYSARDKYRNGWVYIRNACDFPIYLSEASCWGSGETHQVDTNVTARTQLWDPSCSGVTIKLRTSKELSGVTPITQIEYAWTWLHGSKNSLYYDFSNVDCGPTSQTSKKECPFTKHGMKIGSTNVHCPNKTCLAGQEACREAYNLPHDDWATMECNMKKDSILFTACSERQLRCHFGAIAV